MNILCVCTNNYFRSQIMEHLLRAMDFENVRSRATVSAYEGADPHPLVLAAIERHGGHCASYTVQNVLAEDIAWADIIFCAEEFHVRELEILAAMSIRTRVLVMDVLDGGVDNPAAVEKATRQIEEYLSRWKSSIH